jgi:hypothetical protein
MEKKKVDALGAKLEVKYCVPEWLRDENIKISCKRFPERIQLGKELTKEPIALVCFGSSLHQTWERIKDFKYVMSCSGSHKFLMERDIVPTYHVEVDPREHKIKLLGDKISPETNFLMASCCSPKVFDFLVEHNAKITIWHTYSGEKTNVLPMVYPKGEWVSTGGANVGLRAMVLARMLGFTNIHMFGMDGSFPDIEHSHADVHPNKPKDYIVADLDGKEYKTTTAFLECARSTVHEIEQLPDTEFTFYGQGLIQDMVKKSLPDMKKKKKSTIAFYVAPTISAAYVEQNKLLHQSNPTYGVSVLGYLPIITETYKEFKAKSLLDYGCGKGMLAKNLDFPIWEYDPAVPGKEDAPRPADMVVCVDVLEHIEPDYLPAVLTDLARCTMCIGYFIIGTRAAGKTLPDGRNTHLIQQGLDWWTEKLGIYFTIAKISEKDTKIIAWVTPRKQTTTCAEKLILQTAEA